MINFFEFDYKLLGGVSGSLGDFHDDYTQTSDSLLDRHVMMDVITVFFVFTFTGKHAD